MKTYKLKFTIDEVKGILIKDRPYATNVEFINNPDKDPYFLLEIVRDYYVKSIKETPKKLK